MDLFDELRQFYAPENLAEQDNQNSLTNEQDVPSISQDDQLQRYLAEVTLENNTLERIENFSSIDSVGPYIEKKGISFLEKFDNYIAREQKATLRRFRGE